MTTFFLIRHGLNDLVGKAIAGRASGVHLNDEGKVQAKNLAEILSGERIEQIFSSPLERARETAEPLSKKLGIDVQVCDALAEIDFGEWTGKTLDELAPLPEWTHWNTFRSGTRIPGGENILEVQTRMVRQIDSIRAASPGQVIAIFSHGDPLRSVLFYYLGLSPDSFQRMEISPASISILTLSDFGAQVLRLNDTAACR